MQKAEVSARGLGFFCPMVWRLRARLHLGVALGAGDADLAFALGDGEHLAAVGALEICRGLATLPHLLGRALGTLKVFLAGAGRARGAGRCGPAAQAGDELAQAGNIGGRSDKGLVLLATCIDVFGQATQHAEYDDGDGDPAEPLDAGYRSDHRDDDAGKTHYDGEFIGAIATLHKVIHANCLSFDMLHAFIPDLEQGGQVNLHQCGANIPVPKTPRRCKEVCPQCPNYLESLSTTRSISASLAALRSSSPDSMAEATQPSM